MRPRNVLTETNNMRKLMGLPLLNEDAGATAEDVKKKVLTENAAGFSLGFARGGGLTFTEEENDPMEDNVMQEEDLDETTEAEEVEDEGVGAPVNDVVEEQEEDYGEGPEGIATGIDVDGADIYGDGEVPLDQVVAEGDSFAKYNITLQDKMDLLREQEEREPDDYMGTGTPQSESEYQAKMAPLLKKIGEVKDKYKGKKMNVLTTDSESTREQSDKYHPFGVLPGSPFIIHNISFNGWSDLIITLQLRPGVAEGLGIDAPTYSDKIVLSLPEWKSTKTTKVGEFFIFDGDMTTKVGENVNDWYDKFIKDNNYPTIYNNDFARDINKSGLRKLGEDLEFLKMEFKVPDADFLGAIEQEFGSDLA